MSVKTTITAQAGCDIYMEASADARVRAEEVIGRSIDDIPRPEYNGKPYTGILPAKTSSLPLSALGDLLATVTEWGDYINAHMIIAKNELSNTKERLAVVRAHVRQTKSGAVADKDDLVTLDIAYVNAMAAVQQAEEYKNLLENAADSAGRQRTAVSRIIETKQRANGTSGSSSSPTSRRASLR
jgi:hypothetical protein